MKVDKRVRVTPEKLKRMQELRKNGMTYQKIATTVHLSYLTVYKYLNNQKEVKAAPVAPVEVKEEEKAPEAKAKEGFFDRLKFKLGL